MKEKVPGFTIVTPSLNQAPYLGAAIESVVSQAGDFTIEYFIHDGGSTDGSVEIIRGYADRVNQGRYPIRCAGVRVVWLSEKDGGQSGAINRGLRKATGEFAAYLNSDDAYLPGAFAHAARVFANDEAADFIYGDGDVIDEDGRLQWEWLSRPYNQRLMTGYHYLWNDFTNYIMQQATFWRTRVHKQIGLFDEEFHYAMDVEYWVRAGQAGLKLVHTPAKLAQFRMIRGTKSLSSPVVFWGDHLEIFRRYRGAAHLAPFAAYWYFNLARLNGWDLDATRREEAPLLRRWSNLPGQEQAILRAQLDRGWAFAHFLAANELLKQQRVREARALVARAFDRGIRGGLYPWALYARVKLTLGASSSLWLDRALDCATAYYRRRFIDYRLHQRGKAEAS